MQNERECLKKNQKKKKDPPALPYFALARYSNTTIFFWPYLEQTLCCIESCWTTADNADLWYMVTT